MSIRMRGKESVLNKVKKIKIDGEVFDTLLVGGATLFGSVFSYLLQFVLGRKLPVEDYGTFNALLSLSSIIGVFSAVFGTALIKIVAEMYAKKENDKVKYFFTKVLKLSVLACFLIFLIIFFLRGRISDSLNIGDTLLVAFFGFSVGLGFCLVIPSSYLQGMQKFKKYSIFHVITMINRFALPAILVFLGFGLRGVYFAFPLASLISFVIGMFMLELSLKKVEKSDVAEYGKKLLSLGASVVLVNLCMMALNNIDVVLVKKYLPSAEAGYYAGVVTLGKILLFGAGAVTVVMFPKISALNANGKDFMKSLKKLLGILLVVLIVGVFCYQVFPTLITHLFFGKAFENSIKYLPLFSIFVAIYVLINFLVMFSLAIDKKNVGFLLLPGVLMQFILLNFFHGTLWDIIRVNIGVSVFTLLVLISGLSPRRAQPRTGSARDGLSPEYEKNSFGNNTRL